MNLHLLLNEFWTVFSQKQKLILAFFFFFFFLNLYVLIQKKLNLRLQLIVYYFIMLLEVFQYISGNILYVSVSSLKTLNNNLLLLEHYKLLGNIEGYQVNFFLLGTSLNFVIRM